MHAPAAAASFLRRRAGWLAVAAFAVVAVPLVGSQVVNQGSQARGGGAIQVRAATSGKPTTAPATTPGTTTRRDDDARHDHSGHARPALEALGFRQPGERARAQGASAHHVTAGASYPCAVDSVLREGSLAGRSALVTGGGTGIGRATAELLAALGARVAIAGRRAELLEETAAAIRARRR